MNAKTETIVNGVVQKERRLVTMEMQVKQLEKGHSELKQSMEDGFKSIKEFAKLGFTIATTVLTLVFALFEIIMKLTGHN